VTALFVVIQQLKQWICRHFEKIVAFLRRKKYKLHNEEFCSPCCLFATQT
jgi:hypothetical protein